jgi:3-oxoacyl-[acyl-carrier-protein] synthase-1
MPKPVYIAQTNCITPLGFDVDSNIELILNKVSGIALHQNLTKSKTAFHAAVVDNQKVDLAFQDTVTHFTKLEKMLLLALQPVIRQSGIELDHEVALIFSTTKGNVENLEENYTNVVSAQLGGLAQKISDFFGFKTKPIVISNACVSGIMAVSVAKRLIQAEAYKHVFIVAGDTVTEFVVSGFNSFQAMSDKPCKPYSKNRTGVTLGEATAAVLVTSDPTNAKVKILGDGSVNDANHISGPSRTGEGLFRSVESAMKEAKINANQIDYISAHGTATPFNDEMESIAFSRSGLSGVPLNSLKGFYGHTLGASGLLETVIGIESVLRNKLFVSLGYDESGVSEPINIIAENQDKTLTRFLKTASGFGGCNTAVVFEKMN